MFESSGFRKVSLQRAAALEPVTKTGNMREDEKGFKHLETKLVRK